MNKRLLLDKIKKEFPQLKWKRAQHNLQGDDHYVLILDDKYVFRFPRKAKYQARLYNEALLLRYLSKRVDILVPEYKFIAKDKSFAGYPMIRGIQLSRKVFKHTPENSKNKIAKQLADFLSVLHRITLKTACKYQVRTGDVNRSYKKLAKDSVKHIKPRVSGKDYRLIDEFLKEFRHYQKYPKKCLAHCDLYLHHLLVDSSKRKLEGVIDFSDMSMDDPALDFSELWLYGRKFVELVYKNYTGPKDRDFLYRSMLYCKRVPVFMMTFPFLGLGSSFSLGRRLFKEIYSEDFFK